MVKNMRTETQRAEKYKGKLIGDIAKQRIEAYGPTQKKAFAGVVGDQVAIEVAIKKLIGGRVPTQMLVYYIIFAKKIDKFKRKFGGSIVLHEIQILQSQWSNRGLNNDFLDEVKLFMYPQYPEANIFKLDWSYLDGPDGLA